MFYSYYKIFLVMSSTIKYIQFILNYFENAFVHFVRLLTMRKYPINEK